MSYRARVIKTAPQYASITLNGVNSATFTLATAVNKSYSTIEWLAATSPNGSNNASEFCTRVELTSGTTVTAFVQTSTANNLIVTFKVTEYFPWTMLQPVQHLSNTYTFTAVGARAGLYTGGFTTVKVSGTITDAIGGITQASATTATKIGSSSGSQSHAYCVADWK